MNPPLSRDAAEILAAVDRIDYRPRVISDWASFLAKYDRPVEYVIPDLVPEGAQVTVYAPGGIGKSLFALDLALKVAQGSPVFGQPIARRQVLYIDYEHGEGTTADRISDLGIDASDTRGIDGWFHYCPFPDMTLDTRAGASMLADLIDEHDAGLVIIDSLNQATEGRENDSDTFRDFAAHTSAFLREREVASIRLDNTGKNKKQDQRGSSKKRDEVDLSWRLDVQESGDKTFATLHLDKDRFGSAPKLIRLERVEDPYLSHEISSDQKVSAGASKVIQDLERLNI